MKLLRRIRSSITDDELRFLSQVGLRWVRVDLGQHETNHAALAQLQERLARFDLGIYSAVFPVQSSEDVGFGLPGRDRVIESYCRFLQTLGTLGIPVNGYAFHPGNVYTTGTSSDAGYVGRQFDEGEFRKVETVAHGRRYESEEMWDHYSYLMERVLPVAAEADVRLALHPDDPPLPEMNGVARIISSADGYARAAAIAGDSRHWGLLFCVGTWAEGGDRMGKSILEMIREYGPRNQLISVHLRNVDAPLPRFRETFPDDGYVDLGEVVATLAEVGFDGSIAPDHVPQLAGDNGILPAGTAYCIACIRRYIADAERNVTPAG